MDVLLGRIALKTLILQELPKAATTRTMAVIKINSIRFS